MNYKWIDFKNYINNCDSHVVSSEEIWDAAREIGNNKSDKNIEEYDIKLITDAFIGKTQHSELHKINDKYLLIVHYDVGKMTVNQIENHLKKITDIFDEKLKNFFGEGVIYAAILPYRRSK